MRFSARVWLGSAAILTAGAIMGTVGAFSERSPSAAPGPSAPAVPSQSGGPSADSVQTAAPSDDVARGPFRAFEADSWWNTPVPTDAPTHPQASDVLQYMRTAPEAGDGCVALAGAEDSNWGQPVFWAQPDDTAYDVTLTQAQQPPELASLRLPGNARAAKTSDRAMTVFDLEKGYVVALTGARYDEREDTWKATGATVTYLDSDGLHARTGRSDDARNEGSHRGNNGATMMARHDEVVAGSIQHVIKVASGPETSGRHVFPMIGSDGDSNSAAAPAQGLRFRIKPSVDLDALDLHPEARVIAEALQTYGFYIGDSAGVTALKLENTRAEGRGQLWSVSSTALCSLPLSSEFWDVLREGYDPSKRPTRTPL